MLSKDDRRNHYSLIMCVADWAELVEFLYPKGDEGRAWAEKILDEVEEQMAMEQWSITPRGYELKLDASE